MGSRSRSCLRQKQRPVGLRTAALLQQVARAEEGEEDGQAAVDEQRLLAGRHAVGAESVPLVLLEPGDRARPALERALLRAADRTLPVFRKVLRQENMLVE